MHGKNPRMHAKFFVCFFAKVHTALPLPLQSGEVLLLLPLLRDLVVKFHCPGEMLHYIKNYL